MHIDIIIIIIRNNNNNNNMRRCRSEWDWREGTKSRDDERLGMRTFPEDDDCGERAKREG